MLASGVDMSNLIADIYLNNPTAQVTMVGPKTALSPTKWAIQGVLAGNLSLGGAASYGSQEASDAISTLNSKIESTSALVNQFFSVFGVNSSVPNLQIKNVAGSMLNWHGTDNLAFVIPMFLVALRKDQDVRKMMITLMEAVTPTVNLGGFGLTPPLGYNRGNTTNPKGCISVNVGGWLNIPPMMVIENVSFDVSKEVTSNGTPLYIQCSVAVRAAFIVGPEKIKQFLS
jgi:hypothetical protein